MNNRTTLKWLALSSALVGTLVRSFSWPTGPYQLTSTPAKHQFWFVFDTEQVSISCAPQTRSIKLLLNTNVASKSKWKDDENKNMDMALALIIEPVCLRCRP